MRQCPFVLLPCLQTRAYLGGGPYLLAICREEEAGGKWRVHNTILTHDGGQALRCPAKRLHAVQCVRVCRVSSQRPSLCGDKWMDVSISCLSAAREGLTPLLSSRVVGFTRTYVSFNNHLGFFLCFFVCISFCTTVLSCVFTTLKRVPGHQIHMWKHTHPPLF